MCLIRLQYRHIITLRTTIRRKIVIMNLNARLKLLSPSIRDRLHKSEIKKIASKFSYNEEVVRRMLIGNADKYGYKEKNVAKVAAYALEVMRERDMVEELEEDIKAYLAA